MDSWLDHPRYCPTRDRLIKHLRSEGYRFRKLEPVVFLCGAENSGGRDRLHSYLKRQLPNLRLFYAEQVWKQISSDTKLSALQMEAKLASIADLLLIIVESPGTFAELGAFSISDDLRPKILPLVDKKYEGKESFVATVRFPLFSSSNG